MAKVVSGLLWNAVPTNAEKQQYEVNVMERCPYQCLKTTERSKCYGTRSLPMLKNNNLSL
jgi:hypothetical protein